jgi:L-alanine-DL-glutamate epimerase-like enolase superfamily enzyme
VIESVTAAAYRVPTPTPEVDGTFEWDATTAVVVRVRAGEHAGLGWTYSSTAAVQVVDDLLASALHERQESDIAGAWLAMRQACRNAGLRGLVMQAISAVDFALWDLRGRALGAPVATLLGGGEPVRVYGSGGFTNLSDDQLRDQVQQWSELGCTAMKIKIGRDAERDHERLGVLREAAPDAELMVDANGAYSRGAARRMGHALDGMGVVWFEEPVTSDDIEGLRGLREALRCDVTAGEYASDGYEAAGLCAAVDCLQLDATRCGGWTGFVRCAGVAAANGLEVSGHCAPSLHAALSGVGNLRNIEYFSDHARLEPMLFEGVPPVRGGRITPSDAPGHGMSLRADAEQYRVA